MNSRPLPFAIGILTISNAIAAEVSPGTINGRLLDRTNHAPLANATVLVAGTPLGAATDTAGNFSIPTVKHGSYNVEASKLGYLSQAISDVVVSPGRTTEIEFLLDPTAILSSEVVVVRSGYFRRTPDLPTSNRSLRTEEIRRAPGSAEDVQRVIQALPGVAGANDQTNEIVVRGGSPVENLTLLDGIEIDNINHFPTQASSGGPISALNVSFLKDVTFSTGGYSARYGDKASSVLSLEMRDGDHSAWLTGAELSMAGAGIDIEGPISDGQGTFIGSIRRSYLSLIQGAIGLTAVPNYYDGQFRTSWEFSPTVKGSAYGMYSHDWITIESDKPDAWSRGAETVDARYSRYVLGGRVRWVRAWGMGEAVIARSSTFFDEEVFKMPENQLQFRNDATETVDQLHLTFSGKAGGSDEWSVGLSLKPIGYDFDNWFLPDTVDYDFDWDGIRDTTVVEPPWGANRNVSTFKSAAYLQYRWKPRSDLMLIGGIRHDGFALSKRNVLAPRGSIKWDVDGLTAVSFAMGIYYQSLPLFYHVWDPDGGNERLPYSRADHYVLSLWREYGDGKLASFEFFYKDYSKLPVDENKLMAATDPTFRSWRYLPIGTKSAEGVELFLQQKKIADWYGTFSYSLASSTTDNTLDKFPSDYDFRHVATIVAGRDFSLIDKPWFNDFQRRWFGWWTYALPLNGDVVTLSSRYRYVSGRPYTPKVWRLARPRMGQFWDDSGDDNRVRYPNYARWDVRWDSKWFKGSRSVTLFLEVQNVANRANVAEYFYNDDDPEVVTAYQFGFFFIGGVRVGF